MYNYDKAKEAYDLAHSVKNIEAPGITTNQPTAKPLDVPNFILLHTRTKEQQKEFQDFCAAIVLSVLDQLEQIDAARPKEQQDTYAIQMMKKFMGGVA